MATNLFHYKCEWSVKQIILHFLLPIYIEIGWVKIYDAMKTYRRIFWNSNVLIILFIRIICFEKIAFELVISFLYNKFMNLINAGQATMRPSILFSYHLLSLTKIYKKEIFLNIITYSSAPHPWRNPFSS